LADIVYAQEPGLDADEFIDVLKRSTLGERRPINDFQRIQRMVMEADIMLCARDGAGLLIGISRAITDFCYCCYLSDLAVDEAWQGKGIGKELIRRTHEIAGPQSMLLLLSAPKPMTYYPHIGMEKAENAFIIQRKR